MEADLIITEHSNAKTKAKPFLTGSVLPQNSKIKQKNQTKPD